MNSELRAVKTLRTGCAATEEGIWEWQADRPGIFLSRRCDRLLGYLEGGLPRSGRGICVRWRDRRDASFCVLSAATCATGAPFDCVLPRSGGSTGAWVGSTFAGTTEFDGKAGRRALPERASDVTGLRRAQQEVIDSLRPPRCALPQCFARYGAGGRQGLLPGQLGVLPDNRLPEAELWQR